MSKIKYTIFVYKRVRDLNILCQNEKERVTEILNIQFNINFLDRIGF